MSHSPRPLVAGNWKMNGTRAAIAEIRAMASRLSEMPGLKADVAVCPPATLLGLVGGTETKMGGGLLLGGQDCHPDPSGAHTGDVSAEMLADAGAGLVIVGHSERRADHGESDDLVAAKARAAWRAGLAAVICVGETRQERDAGRALEVVAAQVDGSVPDGAQGENTVVAYEPVWAIGSGVTATEADIAEMHGLIRERLGGRIGADVAAGMRILYGGSVKPDNAAALMAVDDVDGALVGGASLKADDFLKIVQVYA